MAKKGKAKKKTSGAKPSARAKSKAPAKKKSAKPARGAGAGEPSDLLRESAKSFAARLFR
jgi:hypothetical protein